MIVDQLFGCPGLLDLAEAYCESQLKGKCELAIQQQVSVDNVAMVIAMATKYKTEVRDGVAW